MKRKTPTWLSFLPIGAFLLALIIEGVSPKNSAFPQGIGSPKASAPQGRISVPINKAKELQEILTRLRNRRSTLVASIKKMNARQKEIELRLKNLYLQQQQPFLQPSERSTLENLIAFEKSRIQQMTTRRRLLIKELNLLLSAERQLRAQKMLVQREKSL